MKTQSQTIRPQYVNNREQFVSEMDGWREAQSNENKRKTNDQIHIHMTDLSDCNSKTERTIIIVKANIMMNEVRRLEAEEGNVVMNHRTRKPVAML